MRLERDAGSISRAIVHEPSRDRGRFKYLLDSIRNDLSPISVKAFPPHRKSWSRSRDKLHAWIESVVKPLIEVMQRHRRKVCEDLTFPRGQRNLRGRVFHEESVVVPVLSDAAITEQRTYQDCLLKLSQLARLYLDFPRRYPTHKKRMGLSPI
jgi:hypothetical protein